MGIPEGTLVPFEGRGRRGRGIVPLDQRNQRNGRQKRPGKIIFLPANYLLIREKERKKVLQELAPMVPWEGSDASDYYGNGQRFK